MKFQNAYVPGGFLWSSPFIRWQGAAAGVNSLDLASQVTRDALRQRGFDVTHVSQLVYGSTVPQAGSFYAGPLVAARMGIEGVGGPSITQACATSVACIAHAAAAIELSEGVQLVVTADRVSNAPLLVYPRPASMGGAPATEHWELDNFAADPWTGESMLATAEATASEGGISREQCDELALLRYEQYQSALKDGRRLQRAFMQPIVVQDRKQELILQEDVGIGAYTAASLSAMRPINVDGVLTAGTQTHPADGAAGLIVARREQCAEFAKGEPAVQLLSAASCRAEKGRMPKAPVYAAQRALQMAGLGIEQVKFVVTHNPFAVNDLWFSKALNFPLHRMNVYGCSLIYGHPQGPTGMRGIVELALALKEQGGGIGLFTGCAAGDMGAALVIRVDDSFRA